MEKYERRWKAEILGKFEYLYKYYNYILFSFLTRFLCLCTPICRNLLSINLGKSEKAQDWAVLFCGIADKMYQYWQHRKRARGMKIIIEKVSYGEIIIRKLGWAKKISEKMHILVDHFQIVTNRFKKSFQKKESMVEGEWAARYLDFSFKNCLPC